MDYRHTVHSTQTVLTVQGRAGNQACVHVISYPAADMRVSPVKTSITWAWGYELKVSATAIPAACTKGAARTKGVLTSPVDQGAPCVHASMCSCRVFLIH